MSQREEHLEVADAHVGARTAVIDAAPRGDTLAPTVARILALQRMVGNQVVLDVLHGLAPRRTLQRRRVVSPLEVMDLTHDPITPDAAAHLAGIQRMNLRAWEELTDDEKAEVRRRRLAGRTVAEFNALSAADQSMWWAHAIRQVRPGLQGRDVTAVRAAWDQMTHQRQDAVRRRAMRGLTPSQFAALTPAEKNARWLDAVRGGWGGLRMGDPNLIDIGPRPGTPEVANLQRLLTNANRIFDEIALPSRTADLRQVFGTANVATARAKYRAARRRMNLLQARGKIVTDRSEYNSEVSLGGLTNSEQLAIAPEVMDHPDDPESVVTIVHEAMHAGNNDVTDHGYIDIDPNTFKTLPVPIKLTNAAHFEVVPRRILVTSHSFAGETFTPAGQGGTANLTDNQKAIRAASEMFRSAWTIGLNLHTIVLRLYRTPRDWNTVDLRREFGSPLPAGTKFADAMPFWSKVMKMTIHERTHIDAAAGSVATNPVTIVDMALAEGVIRKLAHGMYGVPETEAEMTAFLTANATAAEIAAASTIDQKRDLLIRLTLRTRVHSITGSADRDFRVVTTMGTTPLDFTKILKPRSPAAFAD